MGKSKNCVDFLVLKGPGASFSDNNTSSNKFPLVPLFIPFKKDVALSLLILDVDMPKF